MSTGATLLECRGLIVRRGDREIVHNVSFELRCGELVALLGPNGAGKSTLLDALGGALAPAQGEIVRHGRVATALQAPDLARRRVLDNVKLALAWWGVPRAERARRASGALATMRAEHLAARTAATLSGGERRRVHLARVLALAPDVLLLDEPFAGLDAEVRATLLQDSVSALRSETRATLVVVHDRSRGVGAGRPSADPHRRAVGGVRPAPGAAGTPADPRRGPVPRLRRLAGRPGRHHSDAAPRRGARSGRSRRGARGCGPWRSRTGSGWS